MNLPTINAIIFDMDGVIVDSNPLHEKAERLTFLKYGMEVPTEEWRRFKGKTANEIFTYVIHKYGTEKLQASRLIEDKTQTFLELARHDLKLISGSSEFIKKARQKYHKLGLTTSAKMSVVEASLASFDLLDMFDVVVTGDDTVYGKPHPEPYLTTLNKLNSIPRESIVIEDADNGVVSAKQAGCYVAAITTSLSREDLLYAGADIVCTNFNEIAKELQV